MTNTQITDERKEYADIIAEKVAKLSTAQQVRVLGICEGISLAAAIEKASKEDGKGA